MQQTSSTRYSAPEIIGQRDLNGSLTLTSESISDAAMKHGIQPLVYQAPQITDQSDLNGST